MPAPQTLWTHRLVRQSLAIPNTPGYTEAEDALVTLVQHVLEQGSDAPFLQAYDQLLRQGADQAAERLEFWAETCASTRDDLVVDDPTASEPIDLEATIFLMPIWHWQFPDSADFESVLPPQWLESLRDYFEESDRIPPEATLLFFPQWYATSDLPMTWSGRRHWLNQALATIQHPVARPGFPPAETSPEPPWASLRLRWLVGVLISADSSSIPWLDADTSPDDPDLDWPTWLDTLQATLPPPFRGASLTFHPPGAWAPTLAGALAAYQRELLAWQWDTDLPSAVTLTPGDPATTWMLTWHTDGKPQTFAWLAPTVPSHETLLLLVDLLHEWPIPTITIQTPGG